MTVYSQSLNEQECNNLGYVKGLMCSSCNELKQFKLSSLEKNCKQCCIADLEEEEKDKKVVKLLPNVF